MSVCVCYCSFTHALTPNIFPRELRTATRASLTRASRTKQFSARNGNCHRTPARLMRYDTIARIRLVLHVLVCVSVILLIPYLTHSLSSALLSQRNSFRHQHMYVQTNVHIHNVLYAICIKYLRIHMWAPLAYACTVCLCVLAQ